VKILVESIIIICEDSPFGKNSVIESIRMATGILAVGDIENCKVILMGEAVLFLSKTLSPEALNVDSFSNITRLMELSDLEIYVDEGSLNNYGMDTTDLIDYENIQVVNITQISKIILDAEMTFKY